MVLKSQAETNWASLIEWLIRKPTEGLVVLLSTEMKRKTFQAYLVFPVVFLCWHIRMFSEPFSVSSSLTLETKFPLKQLDY